MGKGKASGLSGGAAAFALATALAVSGCAATPLTLEASRGCAAPAATTRSVGVGLGGVGVVVTECRRR